ncbi:MAG: hypothetical protein IIB02_06565 [Thaumarchaeota archaeon]|nr:hypothetical protein [Nitrososphaerota archaeon]
MQQANLVFRIYGKSPTIKIVNFLLGFPKNEFTSTEIIDDLGMSKTTFYKYFVDLVDIGMINVNPKSTKPKLYSINLESPVIQNIRRNIDFVSEKIADKELLKLNIKPIEINIIKLEQLDSRIHYLRKLQRQTKTEIKRLENHIEA